MKAENKIVGIIAGNGEFPILFAKAAKEKGYKIVVAAIQNEADESILNIADAVEWFHLGQLKRLLKYYRKHDVVQTVMIGGIKKTRIFSDIKPDMKAIMFLAGMKHTHDDGLLGALAGFFEKEGIIVKSSTFLIPEILAEEGCWTKKKPGKSQQKDIKTGWHLAKEIGRLDIGQCIVISGGSVLAVEAIDGTDSTIKRGGRLGRGDSVVIKVSKPNQDMRFDIPAVGLETLKNMHESGVSALVIEAGKAVVFNKDDMISYADKVGISIVAME